MTIYSVFINNNVIFYADMNSIFLNSGMDSMWTSVQSFLLRHELNIAINTISYEITRKTKH